MKQIIQWIFIGILALLLVGAGITAHARTSMEFGYHEEIRNGMTYGIWHSASGMQVRNLTLDKYEMH